MADNEQFKDPESGQTTSLDSVPAPTFGQGYPPQAGMQDSDQAPAPQGAPIEQQSINPQGQDPFSGYLAKISALADQIANTPAKAELAQQQLAQMSPENIIAKNDFIKAYKDRLESLKSSNSFWDRVINGPKQEQAPPGAVDTSSAEGRNQLRIKDFTDKLKGEDNTLKINRRSVEDYLMGDDFIQKIEDIRKQEGDDNAESAFDIANSLLSAAEDGVNITKDDVENIFKERDSFINNFAGGLNELGQVDKAKKTKFSKLFATRLKAKLQILKRRQAEDKKESDQKKLKDFGLSLETSPKAKDDSDVTKSATDAFESLSKMPIDASKDKVKSEDSMVKSLLGNSQNLGALLEATPDPKAAENKIWKFNPQTGDFE